MATSDVAAHIKGGRKMFYYVYILFSLRDGKLYIGYTQKLRRRLREHHRGTGSTELRKPLKLVYCEAYTNEIDAKSREEFLKSGYGRRGLKRQLQRTFEVLNYKFR